MSIKEGAIEALIGILIGFIPVVIQILSIPNGATYIGIIELGTVIAALNQIDSEEKIPIMYAIGYYLITYTIGWIFMPEWERGLQTISLITSVISYLK